MSNILRVLICFLLTATCAVSIFALPTTCANADTELTVEITATYEYGQNIENPNSTSMGEWVFSPATVELYICGGNETINWADLVNITPTGSDFPLDVGTYDIDDASPAWEVKLVDENGLYGFTESDYNPNNYILNVSTSSSLEIVPEELEVLIVGDFIYGETIESPTYAEPSGWQTYTDTTIDMHIDGVLEQGIRYLDLIDITPVDASFPTDVGTYDYNDASPEWQISFVDTLTGFPTYDSGNYILSVSTQSELSILPLDINVHVNNNVITYGDQINMVIDTDVDNFLVLGDTISMIDVEFYIDVPDDTPVIEYGDFLLATNDDRAAYHVGTHTINAISTNDNYNITTTSGTLTILSLEVVFEAHGNNYIYGDDVNDQSKYTITTDILSIPLAFADVFSWNEEVPVPNSVCVSLSVSEVRPIYNSNLEILASSDDTDYTFLVRDGSEAICPLVVGKYETQVVVQTITGIEYGNTPLYSVLPAEGYSFVGSETSLNLDLTYPPIDYNGEDIGNGLPCVGTFDITATDSTTNFNYNITAFTPATITIIPRNITIKATTPAKFYGDAPVFAYSLFGDSSLSYGNNIASLNIDFAEGFELETDVNISAGVVVPHIAGFTWTNGNYNISWEDRAYLINKKHINMTVEDKAVEYGNTPLYSASLNTGNNLAYLETIADLGIDYNSDLDVGVNIISTTVSNTNYDISFTTEATLTVSKLPITIIINDASTIYGDAPNYTFSLASGSSLAFGQQSSVLNLSFFCNDINCNNAPYDINHTYNNPNYLITFVGETSGNTGKLHVTPRSITIKVKDTDIVFDSDYVLSGLDVEIVSGSMASGEMLSSLNLTFGSYGSVVNDYTVDVVANNSNYEVTTQEGTITIVKRVITITPHRLQKKILDADPIFSYSVDEQGIPLTGELFREEGNLAGEYIITIGTLDAGVNYELVLEEEVFVISNEIPAVGYVGLGTFGLSIIGFIIAMIRKSKGFRIMR